MRKAFFRSLLVVSNGEISSRLISQRGPRFVIPTGAPHQGAQRRDQREAIHFGSAEADKSLRVDLSDFVRRAAPHSTQDDRNTRHP